MGLIVAHCIDVLGDRFLSRRSCSIVVFTIITLAWQQRGMLCQQPHV